MSKEITKKEDVKVTQVTSSTDSFITQALASNASVEVLTQLFQLQKDVKAEQAKEAFIRAMANFQKKCPQIEKTKKVMVYSQERYRYAPLDAIVSQVRDLLAENELSYSIQADVDGDVVKATCTITHVLGHSQSSSFNAPIEDKKSKEGNSTMSKPQQYATALTFAKRYAFCNVLGILTTDEDTDAVDSGKKEKKPVEVKSRIVFLLKALSYNTETKESIANAVLTITKLPLEEKNFPKIVEFLEFAVSEKNADKSKE
jgi:hypothetical protein